MSSIEALHFSSVESLSCVRLFATPWTAAHQATLSITNSQSLPKPMSIESVMPSNHLFLCHPFLLLPSIFPSIGVFSNDTALWFRWPKYWSFSFSITPSNEQSGLISFRMDWMDLFAVQGTLNSLFQHDSSKHQFFSTQLSLYCPNHPDEDKRHFLWNHCFFSPRKSRLWTHGFPSMNVLCSFCCYWIPKLINKLINAHMCREQRSSICKCTKDVN